MLETIQTFSSNIIAIRARGKGTGEDYETVLMPIVEAKLAD